MFFSHFSPPPKMSIHNLFATDSLGRHIYEFLETPKSLLSIRLVCESTRYLEPHQQEMIENYARNKLLGVDKDMWSKKEHSLERVVLLTAKFMINNHKSFEQIKGDKAYWNLFEIKCIFKLPDCMVK